MEVKELMDTSEAEVLNRTQPGRKAAASWRTLPVQSELDRHEESAHAQLETPDGLTLIGAAMIVGCGVLILGRRRRPA